MSFKFFASLDFTGEPSSEQFRSAYGLGVMKTCPSPISDYQNLTINQDSINYYVDLAISQGWEAIAWDEENPRFVLGNPSMTEAEKDAALNCLVQIYTLSKARAASQGKPDLKIGWYDIPGGFANSYYAPLQYTQNPSNPTYAANYQSWTNWMDRLSKRYVNGAYITSPFSDCCDFVASSIYVFYGNGQSFINDWKIFARVTLQQMKLRVSNGKPTYGFCTFSFHPSDTYIGTMVSGSNMSQMIDTVKTYADGMVMWGGFGASYKYSDWFWRPSGSSEASDLITWKTVTNGAFSISIANAKLKIQNINTSSAISMTQVASILQSAIQTKISSAPNPSYDGNYPYPLGTVTVTWSSSQKGFLFNMTTNGASTPQPPNFHRGFFSIESKNAWGANISGTDLASDQFIGVPTNNSSGLPGNAQWVYGGTQSTTEWNLYAEFQDWWTVYSDASSLTAEIAEFEFFFFFTNNIVGLPTPAYLEDTYGIIAMQTGGCTPWTQSVSQAAITLLTSKLTISTANIDAAITTYLHPSLGDNQKKFFSFDLEPYGVYLDPSLYSDTVIDNMLESMIEAATTMKSRLATNGIYDVKVGFYLNPSFKSYYYPVLYTYYKGNSSQYNTDYNTWVAKFKRMNLRKSGSTYIAKKFADYVDFVTCEIYPYYGESDPFDNVYFKENIYQAARYLSGSKPLYAYINPAFHPSTPWAAKPVSGDYMIKMTSWAKRACDGVILWMTSNPSYRGARQRHFMTASGGPPAVPTKTLANWKAITNGCFSYFAAGYNRQISGVNFSSATSIGGSESTSVVNIIEAAINADLYYINSFVSHSVTYPSLTLSRPYEVGYVTVTYNSNTSNNGPTSLTQVPCIEISYTDPSLQSPPDQSSYTGREFAYCYTYGTVPVGGTDIGVADWIGTYTYTDQEYDSNYYSGSDYNSDEWSNGWVLNNKWWHAFAGMAIANKYSREKRLKIFDNMGGYTGSTPTTLSPTWYNKPKPYVLKNNNNMDRVYLAYTSSTGGWSQYTTSYITTHLNACIAQQSTYFVWDIEGDYCNVTSINNSPYGVSEATVDANLDHFKDVYTRTKSIAASLGHPEILVGFYGSPFTANTYYGAAYWGDSAYYPSFAAAGSQFANGLIRINQRISGGPVINDPFLKYNDFLAPSYYPQGGNTSDSDSNKIERDAIKGSMTKILEIFGHSKPILPYFMPTFFEQGGQSPLTGWAQKSYFAEMTYLEALKYGADGAIMWYGHHPSNQTTNHKFTPTVTKTLSNWQAITNGCFIIGIEGCAIKVTGLNFSAATSIGGTESTSVAKIIQTGINNQIATFIVWDYPWSSSFASPPKTPRNIGDVTVTWDGTRFIMNSQKGTTKTPSGFVAPPDFEKSYFWINPWSTWLAANPSIGALPGTDIGVDQWIGAHNIYNDITLTVTDKNDEWRWAEGTEWWNSYKALSIGADGTSISNRVVPNINLVTPSTGETPYTVHVDALQSLFNGVNPQDCVFEWDFGDTYSDVNSKNRGYCSDHRNDCDVSSVPFVHKKTSLSSKQRGINAAYTYWNAGTYLITLKIWHNGAASETVQISVIVSAPSTVAYPSNDLNKWVTLQVIPDGASALANAFSTINDAITWINANRPNGKVIIELMVGRGGYFNFLLTSKVTLTKPNIVIYASKTHTTTNAIIAANTSFNRSSLISLFDISADVYGIRFTDIQFGSSSTLAGDTAGQEQGSPSTSNLIGCRIYSPSAASSVVSNITFTNCYFRNLYQSVTTSHFVSGVYFNQGQSSQTYIKSFDFLGSNIVMNGMLFGTLNGFSDGAQTTSVITSTDFTVNFGSSSGGLAEKFAMNFCHVWHNANYHGNTTSYSGSVKIVNARFATIYGCYLYDGSNTFSDAYCVRMDANEVTGGGTNSAIVVESPSSEITIVNNVVFPNSYTKPNNTRINSGVFEFGGSYGVISGVKIVNNTAIADTNQNYQKAFWNFKRPTGIELSGIEFVNNLSVENASRCISFWIMVEPQTSSYFKKFESNMWPMRVGPCNFAILYNAGNQNKTWDQWVALGQETNPKQSDVIGNDLKFIYKYKLLKSAYPELTQSSSAHPSASKDYNDEARDISSFGTGATRPWATPSYSSAAFTIAAVTSTRTRYTTGAWTPPSGAQNLYVNITDPTINTVDSNWNSVSKPVIKNASGYNKIIDMSEGSLTGSPTRAFRIRYSPTIQTVWGYTDDIKSVYAAIINDTSDGNAMKFMLKYTKNDNTTGSIKFKTSDYATIKEMVDDINNYKYSHGLFGLTVDMFGCGYLSPTKLWAIYNSSAQGTNTDLTIETEFNNVLGLWKVSYFNPFSPTVGISGSNLIGNFLKTTFNVTSFSDGYDVDITYTNDGPNPIDYGTSPSLAANLPGDLRQRIGNISLDGIMVGIRNMYIDQRNGTEFQEYDTWLKNYYGSGLEYPFDKFSPTTILVGETYAVGVSFLINFPNASNKMTELVMQYDSKTTIQNTIGANVYADNGFANDDPSLADCVLKGQTATIKVSVRVTRNIKDFVKVLKPYKDFFASTYGGVRYVKDSRPLIPLTPAIQHNEQPLYYHEYQGAQNPALHGWAWWSNKIKNNYKIDGYERQLMWSPAGMYYGNSPNNYPSKMLTPFFDSVNNPEHFATSITDSCATFINNVCAPFTHDQTVHPPNHPYPLRTDLLRNTLPMLVSAIQEVPVFGFYQGYASIVHKKWNPTDIRDFIATEDFVTPEATRGMWNEWHLMFNYAKVNWIGLDAFATGVSSSRRCMRFFDVLGGKYDGVKMLAELSPDDILCRESMSYLRAEDVTGPHLIADYILPGHEHAAFVWMNNMWVDFSYTYNTYHVMNIMAAMARRGYSTGTVENASLKTSGIPMSSFYAADRRFVYDTKPSPVASLAAPSEITHTISDTNVSFDYPDVREQTIKLGWKANTEGDFSHYVVSRAPIINGQPDTSGTYQVKAYVKRPAFVDYQVYPSKTYYYKISSVDVYGNVSSETPYQVTHVADSPILNPPKNASAAADVSHGTISVSWNDPSGDFLPSSSHKSPPTIIIQGEFTTESFSSQLFDLPYVYTMINGVILYGDGDGRTIQQIAQDAFDRVKTYKDRWLATTGRGRSTSNFRWAFFPQNFGYGWTNINDRPFYHTNDKLSNGSHCLWIENGIAQSRPKMQEFFQRFSQLLRAEGIPDPVYMDPDYESGISFAGDDWSQRLNWHSWLMADPRSTSTPFDGIETYAHYTANLVDLDGHPIPTNELYPFIYALDDVSVKRVFAQVSMTTRALDYGLNKMIYEPAKSVWPNVQCGNFVTCGATRKYLVSGVRFKESPVDFGPHMHGDVQVVGNYGTYLWDNYNFPTKWLTGNYPTNIQILNIDETKIRNSNDLMKTLRLAKADYDIKGCYDANPNKRIALWWQYNNYNVPLYNNLYEVGNQKYPTDFRGAVMDDRDTLMSVFRMMNKSRCDMIGFFCGQTVTTLNVNSLLTYNDLYKVVSNLQEAGYVMPGS